MINRNYVLGACALTALMSQVAQAMPALPDPETPPVTLQFTSTYFTNIAGSSAALANARGVKRIDELYSPSINLNLVEPMGGLSLFLAGQAGYDFHQRNSILDRERIGLQGGGTAHLNVCETSLVGSYSRYQSDVGDLIVGTTKNTQQLMSGELDATCNQSGRIVPSASISQTQSSNSALLYKTQDYDSTAATTSVLYKAGSLGAISLFGQYTQTDYPNRVFALSTGAQSDGYSRYAGGVHYERC